MQVGLNTSSLSSSRAASETIKQQPTRQIVGTALKSAEANSDFPASPLIATRPQRYSVQLNDQLTVLQQADHYLGQLEQQMLALHHASRRGGESARVAQTQLQNLLEKRVSLSGGTVDGQLRPVLQGEARVYFQAPQLAQAFQQTEPEALLFRAHDGNNILLAAVTVSDDMNARQRSATLNHALRRVGIQSHTHHNERLFSVREAHWPQLQTSLSVMGEGRRFPASTPGSLTLQPVPSQAEQLLNALNSGAKIQPLLQQTLDNLDKQRETLGIQQEKARQRIDSMARFPQTQSAVETAEGLAQVLNRASHNYQILEQAVSGQASLSRLTVRSLLR